MHVKWCEPRRWKWKYKHSQISMITFPLHLPECLETLQPSVPSPGPFGSTGTCGLPTHEPGLNACRQQHAWVRVAGNCFDRSLDPCKYLCRGGSIAARLPSSLNFKLLRTSTSGRSICFLNVVGEFGTSGFQVWTWVCAFMVVLQPAIAGPGLVASGSVECTLRI